MLKDFRYDSHTNTFIFNSNQRLYLIIISILVVAFVLVFYVLPPYGSNVATDPIIKITYADYMSDSHLRVIALFNKQHEGQIEVVPINLPFSKFSTNDRKELLARYFRSKSDRIDVFSVDQIWVPRFTKWCLPLANYIPARQVEALSKYAMHTCYFNNELVAAPLYLDIAVMFYRKDLIDALPNAEYWESQLDHSITWQNLFRLRKEMHNGNRPFFVFQAAPYEGLSCIYTELIANMNEQMALQDSMDLGTPAAENALQFLVDMVQKQDVSPRSVLDFNEDQSYEYFLKNNGVFLRAWPGFARERALQKKFPESFFDCVPAPLPHLEGSKPAYIFGGWNLMISRFSTKIPEAAEFVRFLLSKESQEMMYRYDGILPINDSVYADSSFVKEYPELRFYQSLLKGGVYRPFSSGYTRASDILSYYLNLAIRGKISAKKALQRAAKDIGSIGDSKD